jgi:hypothetical protein
MEVGGKGHAPAALPPGKTLGTHCTGSGVDPRTGLNGCGKPHLQAGFDRQTAQPVANSYTDYAIPAHISLIAAKFNFNAVKIKLVLSCFH